jgi:hypothetical protein
MSKMPAHTDAPDDYPHAANEHDDVSLWPYELEFMQKLSKIHPLRAIVIRSPHMTMRAWFEDTEQQKPLVRSARYGKTLH